MVPPNDVTGFDPVVSVSYQDNSAVTLRLSNYLGGNLNPAIQRDNRGDVANLWEWQTDSLASLRSLSVAPRTTYLDERLLVTFQRGHPLTLAHLVGLKELLRH